MTMPNFIVIGTAKSGTTGLHRYLKQHPEIYMSHPKELRFFAFENQRPVYRGLGADDGDASTIITTLGDYRACFEPGARYPARGESSPVYMYYSQTAERIRHHIPDAKLIVILRNPVDRAYSHFLSKKRDKREPLSFVDALNAEEQRIANGWSSTWHYCQRGFYAVQLAPYFDLFKREQLRVYMYEDYVSDPVGLMQDIFRFINVDDTFVPDISVRHNDSRYPHNFSLQTYLVEPRKSKNIVKQFVPARLSRRIGDKLRGLNLHKPPIPEAMRRHLTAIYREDIIKLEQMLKRDLSHWLK